MKTTSEVMLIYFQYIIDSLSAILPVAIICYYLLFIYILILLMWLLLILS